MKSVSSKERQFYDVTKYLLENYRTLLWMNENFSGTVIEPKQLFSWSYMVDQIDKSLLVLRKKPQDGEILYNLIYNTYILPEALTHLDILDRIHISSRHYYRLREKAIYVLSVILWSAMAQEVKTLLEERAYAIFNDFVDSVIEGKQRDISEIELTMDYMLGFGYGEKIEGLYKKLCRFLYPKYPQLVESHVRFYLEINGKETDMPNKEYVTISFALDQTLYDNVRKVLEPLGLTVEGATELFFEAVARLGKIPFDYSDAELEEAKNSCKVREDTVFEDIKAGLEQAIELEKNSRGKNEE